MQLTKMTNKGRISCSLGLAADCSKFLAERQCHAPACEFLSLPRKSKRMSWVKGKSPSCRAINCIFSFFPHFAPPPASVLSYSFNRLPQWQWHRAGLCSKFNGLLTRYGAFGCFWVLLLSLAPHPHRTRLPDGCFWVLLLRWH